jgi:hypothetical protein
MGGTNIFTVRRSNFAGNSDDWPPITVEVLFQGFLKTFGLTNSFEPFCWRR